MDIRLLMQRASRLNPDLFPEVQERMHQCRRDAREAEAIRDCECRGEEKRAVLLIFVEIKCGIARQNLRDVVGCTRVVERAAREDSNGRHYKVKRGRKIQKYGTYGMNWLNQTFE